jgi:flagellar biosynthesis/type III secretory pathway chaperone
MNHRAAGPLLDELLQALRAEQQALVRGDADALPALAGIKAQALDQLGIALRAVPHTARAPLLDTLGTAQQINETNAALISSRMAVNRARLDTLLSLAGHDTGAAVYGARGDRGALPATPRASASA